MIFILPTNHEYNHEKYHYNKVINTNMVAKLIS